jgi:hypothetical protein
VMPTTGRMGSRSARSTIMGDAARSEAEFSLILDQLRSQDNMDPEVRSQKTLAVIPQQLLDPVEINVHFYSNNGFVEDAMALERERKVANPWTDSEKAVFLDKYAQQHCQQLLHRNQSFDRPTDSTINACCRYLQYPKNFNKIVHYLPDKQLHDVIWYYYQHKKTLNLKKLLLDQQLSKRNKRSRPILSVYNTHTHTHTHTHTLSLSLSLSVFPIL